MRRVPLLEDKWLYADRAGSGRDYLSVTEL